MKTENKLKSGSVKIEPEVLSKVKEYCKKKGMLVSYFVTEAVAEKLKKSK